MDEGATASRTGTGTAGNGAEADTEEPDEAGGGSAVGSRDAVAGSFR
jgi:hypothetical protein